MNLEKLFDMQKELGKVGLFNYKREDRFEKLVLALLVELGECANEWRGFKFWSKDQQPRKKALRSPAMMEEDKEYYNPLLEEYVDCLHFILELGIELDVDIEALREEVEYEPFYQDTLTNHFHKVFRLATLPVGQYKKLFNAFVGLGEWLGFSWDDVEKAYFEKNAINHKRQEVGY